MIVRRTFVSEFRMNSLYLYLVMEGYVERDQVPVMKYNESLSIVSNELALVGKRLETRDWRAFDSLKYINSTYQSSASHQ